MKYVPKQKSHKPIIIIMIVVVIILMIVGIVSLTKPSNESENRRFCVNGLDEEATLEALKEQNNDVIEISDHFYYGESLNLFEHDYDPSSSDSLSGKTIKLVNVVNNSAISMTLENSVDSRLLVDGIVPGFYRMYIIDNLKEKRMVYDETIEDDIFHTIKREGKINEITLIARKDLLKDYNVTYDKNYMFLKVESKPATNNEIDVLIDPYGMNLDLTYLPDKGYENKGLVENDEMFEAATIMKKYLEDEYGLRVAISRKNKNEEGKTYGDNGHLSIGYKQKAKYYLMLRFNFHGNNELRGFEIAHSHYSSKTLARTINYQVSQNTKLPLSLMYSGNDAGIVSGLLIKGIDNQLIYDDSLYLREAGGRATLAARYSETAQEENQSFKNANGMNGLKLSFIYLSNDKDVAYWKAHKEELVKQVAQGFAQGIQAKK